MGEWEGEEGEGERGFSNGEAQLNASDSRSCRLNRNSCSCCDHCSLCPSCGCGCGSCCGFDCGSCWSNCGCGWWCGCGCGSSCGCGCGCCTWRSSCSHCWRMKGWVCSKGLAAFEHWQTNINTRLHFQICRQPIYR